jgi:uncharacterized protein YyaL (SSP411 family)
VNFEFLLNYYLAHKDDDNGRRALQMVDETFEAMARGGIHDHVGKVV